MTDPVYGDNPLDPDARWYQTMRPPLVNDPEIQVWRVVIGAAVREMAESSWLVRWRTKSVASAEGVHLDAHGLDVGLMRPDGWDEQRYRNVLVPVVGAMSGNRPPSVTKALAAGLVHGGQTWKLSRPGALVYVVYFFGLTPNEALTYFDVLNLGRPTSVRLVLVYSPEAEADVFELDESELDGDDVLAYSAFSDP